MGREILFRGKRIDNGEWIEGFYVKHGSRHWIYTGEIQYIYLPVCAELPTKYEVSAGTVCQYTGLTDKNDRKIFDGDIVKGVAYSADFIGYIVWIDEIAGFGVKYFSKNREPTAWENSSILKAIQRWKQPNEFQAEIIGNIFDNPELLNQ